jgi:hypothetical protein
MKLFSGIDFGRISIKNIIATRAYCSNLAMAVGDEILIDCPYQIMNTINNVGVKIDGIQHTSNANMVGIEIACLVAFMLFTYQHKNDVTPRLYEFIDYNSIKMQVRNLIVLITIILFRNVDNAL